MNTKLVDKAHNFKKSAKPIDAEWLMPYAKWKYEHYENTWRSVDQKADTVIRYLGGGLGLVAIGTLLSINENNSLAALGILPSMICALIAVWYAVKSRGPLEYASPTLFGGEPVQRVEKGEHVAVHVPGPIENHGGSLQLF